MSVSGSPWPVSRGIRSRRAARRAWRSPVDADLHAAGQDHGRGSPSTRRREADDPAAAAVERLEGHRLQADAVRRALPGEGLHEPLVRAHLVERPVEAVASNPSRPPTRTGSRRRCGSPSVDARLDAARPIHWTNRSRSVQARKTRSGGCVELARDRDRRQVRVGLDRGLVGWSCAALMMLLLFSGRVAVGRSECRRRPSGPARRRGGGTAPRPPPVALDPLRHQVEHLRLEVHRPALGVPAAADQPGVLEHLEVLGDRLDAHVVRRRELAHRGVAAAASRATRSRRVGSARAANTRDSCRPPHSSTNWLNNGPRRSPALSTVRLTNRRCGHTSPHAHRADHRDHRPGRPLPGRAAAREGLRRPRRDPRARTTPSATWSAGCCPT